MKKALYQVESLSCAGCGKKIVDSLKIQGGVISVNVLHKLGKIRIEFDNSKINSEEIEETIRSLGYEILSKKIL